MLQSLLTRGTYSLPVSTPHRPSWDHLSVSLGSCRGGQEGHWIRSMAAQLHSQGKPTIAAINKHPVPHYCRRGYTKRGGELYSDGEIHDVRCGKNARPASVTSVNTLRGQRCIVCTVGWSLFIYLIKIATGGFQWESKWNLDKTEQSWHCMSNTNSQPNFQIHYTDMYVYEQYSNNYDY